MQLDVVDTTGKKVGEIEVADAVFGRNTESSASQGLLWEMVKAQRAAKRSGTHSTKRRGEVSGGGQKPYRQKGTGNARQGSSRAPHFVGGGSVFGPKPRDYSYTVPKKVKRAALATALSLRASEKKLFVVDQISLETPKTKTAVQVLAALGVPSALVVDDKGNQNLALSLRNLEDSKWIAPEGLNVYDILDHAGLIISRESLKAIEDRVVPPSKGESGSNDSNGAGE